MPITIAFTVSSAFAVIVNALVLVILHRYGQRLRERHLNGRLAKITRAVTVIWLAILVEDLMMIIAGIGILGGVRVLGFLLAGVPLVSVLIGVVALRGLLR